MTPSDPRVSAVAPISSAISLLASSSSGEPVPPPESTRYL
jgi:hypothetical protein